MKVLLHDVTCRYVRSMWHLSSGRCWHLARGAVPYWPYCAVLRHGDKDVKVWFDSTNLWSASYKIYISRSTLKQKTRHKKWTLKKNTHLKPIGGFKHVLFFHIIIGNNQIDFHIFQRVRPTTNQETMRPFPHVLFGKSVKTMETTSETCDGSEADHVPHPSAGRLGDLKTPFWPAIGSFGTMWL